MFVIVSHQINNPEEFQSRAQGTAFPEGLKLHQVLPGTDGVRQICLWEGPSEEAVQTFVDGALGSASDNTYIAIAAEHAVGLPAAAR